MSTLISTYNFDHLDCVVYTALYTSVKNAGALKKRIISASLADGPEGEAERDAVDFAFIDASLVCPLSRYTRLHLF
jgi:EKC/KEOPS complex subunit CGI121/TPRKB